MRLQWIPSRSRTSAALDSLPGGGDLDEDALAADAGLVVLRDDLACLRDGLAGVVGEAGVYLGGDAAGDDGEDLASEGDGEGLEGEGGDGLIGGGGAGLGARLLEDAIDDGLVGGHLGGGGDERGVGGGVRRLELFDGVDVAGVGDHLGHAAKLFEKGCHGSPCALSALQFYQDGAGCGDARACGSAPPAGIYTNEGDALAGESDRKEQRRSMRALMIDRPGEARVIEMERPAADPQLATMRVRRIGLCGSDLTTYLGKNPMVTYPRIPGHEVAATLEHVPANELGLKAGMNVTMSPYTSCGKCSSCRQGRFNACRYNETLGVQRDGALMDYLAMPVEKIYAAPLPLEELALVEPLTVGCHAVARGLVTAKDTVAVYGCGGVGLGAVAAAAFRDARVVAIDIDDKKLAIAKDCGARELINTTREDVHAGLQEISGGHGPDVIIEAIGRPDTYRAAVEEVSFAGRVVYIGYAKENVSFETRLFVQKELDIRGSRNALPEDFREVIRMFEQKRFPTAEAISATVPLDEAPAILRAWSENPAAYTKIMIALD